MTVLLTLISAGTNSGPFDLYSNLDFFAIPFQTGVSKAALLGGFTTSLVPDYATTVRVRSTGACINFIDIVLSSITTTSTTILSPTTTTSTTCSVYSYTVNNYLCSDCTPNGVGALINNYNLLTIGKYYYLPSINRKILVTGFNGCNVGLGENILDSTKQDTCAAVSCV